MMGLNVALAQMAPVWLNRDATLDKVCQQLDLAAGQGAELVVFGEALVPGYPFWPDLLDGARFESDVQKDLFAYYAAQAVDIESGQLDAVCRIAAQHHTAVYLGTSKLMPTYEERLVWSTGDGHGLQVHELGEFRVGGLNCWENWMPLPRAALYGQGENLHVAVWPGSRRNTEDITRFIARESRSYVVSVSGMMHADWISGDIPHIDAIRASASASASANASGWLADGGSCIAGPDGKWVIEPQVGEEGIHYAELSIETVARERQNFDPAGHYSRPDVTRLKVNRKRQKTVTLS
jgi:nitrilase